VKRQQKHIEHYEKRNDYQRFFKALTADINWVNSLLTVLFIGALLLTVFEIHIYRKTLIHWAIPTLIWFSTGLIMTPLTSNFLKKHYSISSFFLQLVYNVVTWGGILIFTFMATNYYLPKDDPETISTKIITTGHLAKGVDGCGEPYCDIVVRNIKKQLVFPCDFDLENYQEIELTIRKGFLGFDIITNKNFTNVKKNTT
jgi:hypothetical protein